MSVRRNPSTNDLPETSDANVGPRPPTKEELMELYASLDLVILGREENRNWNDALMRTYPGYTLSQPDTHVLVATAKEVMNSLCTGISEKDCANILLLAWNLWSPTSRSRNAGRVYQQEMYYQVIGDTVMNGLENSKSVVGKASPPVVNNVTDDDLVCCMCYVAASLLRLFTKEPKSYLLAYERHLKGSYYKFYGKSFPLTNFTPDQDVLVGLAWRFTRVSMCKGTLARFLYNFNGLTGGKGLCAMLFEQHLELTGMHAVGLFMRCCESMPIEADDLVNACRIRATEAALQTITHLLEHFVKAGTEPNSPNSRQTWKYSRIYGPDYFSEVQTKNCKELVYVLATICELLGLPGSRNIMDIAQLQGLPSDLKDMHKKAAERIHALYTQRKEGDL